MATRRKRQRNPTHYCTGCGTGMAAREDRLCLLSDHDPCVPMRYETVASLPSGHPRVVQAEQLFLAGACRHRPQCKGFPEHKAKLTRV
jgi:hypothetical protein